MATTPKKPAAKKATAKKAAPKKTAAKKPAVKKTTPTAKTPAKTAAKAAPKKVAAKKTVKTAAKKTTTAKTATKKVAPKAALKAAPKAASKAASTGLHYDKTALLQEYTGTFDMMMKATVISIGAVLLYFFVMITFLGGFSMSKTNDFHEKFSDRIDLGSNYDGTKLPMYETEE